MSNKEKLIKALENLPNDELAGISANLSCIRCPARKYCSNKKAECCYDVMLKWLNATNKDLFEEQTQADERIKFAEWILQKDILCASSMSIKDLARFYVEEYENELFKKRVKEKEQKNEKG